jgi:hypothetical protein
MHYVVLRDDDTNATTPVECLEQLYRPFLERGLPVNLAAIPAVRLDARRTDGTPEEFLWPGGPARQSTAAIGENPQLVSYLRANPGYGIVQHGYDHSLFEFDSERPEEIRRRMDHGTELLREAGFPKPQTFVAPYDRFSGAALREAVKRFRVVSTGWFEMRRLPATWWPRYLLQKMRRRPHWRMGRTWLLSHPGCLLSRHRPVANILEELKRSVESRRLTVLVTHWWEYFQQQTPNKPFLDVLHATANYLSSSPNIRVISFEDVSGSAVV